VNLVLLLAGLCLSCWYVEDLVVDGSYCGPEVISRRLQPAGTSSRQ
jgi:hypothetical protein